MTPSPPPGSDSSGPRDRAIDQFRGFAIFTMVIANFIGLVHAIPAWLKHAPDTGLTVIDFIAPFFIFAIGLTFPSSVKRRFRVHGKAKTVEHVLKRALALIGIGALFTVGQVSFGFYPYAGFWGLLQAIGAAILLAFPLLFLPPLFRLLVSFGLLLAYQWALDAFWLSTVMASAHGGVQGALSWAVLLAFATAYADFYENKNMRAFWLMAVVMLVMGLVAAQMVPISKPRVSLSYTLVTCSASALVFGLFHMGRRWTEWIISFLEVWGKNPLALYLLHQGVLSFFLLPSARGWYYEAPLWLTALQTMLLLCSLHLIARLMAKKNIFISL